MVVNFYAPWCPWCQRLEPTWEAVTQEVHTKYPDSDGRIRYAKVQPVCLLSLLASPLSGPLPVYMRCTPDRHAAETQRCCQAAQLHNAVHMTFLLRAGSSPWGPI